MLMNIYSSLIPAYKYAANLLKDIQLTYDIALGELESDKMFSKMKLDGVTSVEIRAKHINFKFKESADNELITPYQYTKVSLDKFFVLKNAFALNSNVQVSVIPEGEPTPETKPKDSWIMTPMMYNYNHIIPSSAKNMFDIKYNPSIDQDNLSNRTVLTKKIIDENNLAYLKGTQVQVSSGSNFNYKDKIKKARNSDTLIAKDAVIQNTIYTDYLAVEGGRFLKFYISTEFMGQDRVASRSIDFTGNGNVATLKNITNVNSEILRAGQKALLLIGNEYTEKTKDEYKSIIHDSLAAGNGDGKWASTSDEFLKQTEAENFVDGFFEEIQ